MDASTKTFSSKQEKMVSEYLGSEWKIVAGSGAAPCAPGDVIGPEWLIECKTHTKQVSSLIFKSNVWNKIKQEAAYARRYPALLTDDGTQKSSHTWVIVRARDVDASELSIHSVSIRSTVNLVVNYSEITASCTKLPTNTAFACNLAGDSCYLLRLDTFRELIGD